MTKNETEARALLKTATTATLSVIDHETGFPSGSLVNHIVDNEQRPVLFISSLARHHKALLADNRASLLVQSEEATKSLSGLRASFQGRMEKVTRTAELERLWVQSHAEAESYVSLADFDFWRMTPELIHIVAGFGRIETVRL
jgi:putative heme iron utilization protein